VPECADAASPKGATDVHDLRRGAGIGDASGEVASCTPTISGKNRIDDSDLRAPREHEGSPLRERLDDGLVPV
jgi:hypothetical protein